MEQIILGEKDPKISKGIRVFLEALNSGDGPALELFAPKDANQPLIDTENSVSYNYCDIQESERTIRQDGQTIKK